MILWYSLLAILAILAVAAIGLDLQYRTRAGNRLALTAGKWELEPDGTQKYNLTGSIELVNQTDRLEIMVPEIRAEVTVLSDDSLTGVTTTTAIIPRYKGADVRADGYWESYIVKVGCREPIDVKVQITAPDVSKLKAAWVRIHFFTYGPGGRQVRTHHVIVPLKFPTADASKRWRPTNNADLLPIRTHLLSHLDDPVEVVKRYVQPYAQKGDIVTIGESPVAIMQGRFRYPGDVKPGWLARRLCYMFHPTSSLATACGLQALIDIAGAQRVFLAFVISIPFKLIPRSLAKSLQVDGMFYRIAGEQANLIDDVTGTLPPYDKFIVLGPKDPQGLCDRIQRETGLSAAVVDVNDLRRVKILAATADVSEPFLSQALITNPAGNANEQTPLVLIRPTETTAPRSAQPSVTPASRREEHDSHA